MIAPIIISLLAGTLIEVFFMLVRYRDNLNKVAPRPVYSNFVAGYLPLYQPVGYMSVVDFLSGGTRRWGIYYLFRLLPPAVVLILLSAILGRYFSINNPVLYVLIAATISILPHDAWMILKAKFVSEKLIHIANILLVYVISTLIVILSVSVNINFVAPSVSGLFDNLWSTLLVASIALLYSKITNPRPKYIDQEAETIARDNYIFESYKQIKAKYSTDINRAIFQYAVSKPILYAVLIYENMNRPHWIRRLENAIVSLTKQELTIGIAQVKSDKVLTDSESIMRAGKILEGSSFADSGYGSGFVDIQQLETILRDYNSSVLYAESVAEIMASLRIHTTDIFPFNYGNIN